MADFHVPDAMIRSYRIEGVKADGSVETLCSVQNNYQRLNRIPLSGTWIGVRLVPLAAWNSETIHLFSFDLC